MLIQECLEIFPLLQLASGRRKFVEACRLTTNKTKTCEARQHLGRKLFCSFWPKYFRAPVVKESTTDLSRPPACAELVEIRRHMIKNILQGSQNPNIGRFFISTHERAAFSS